MKRIFNFGKIALVCILCAIVFVGCGPKGELSYYQQKVLEFEEENKTVSYGQIVFVGDSITDGYDLDKAFPECELKLYNRGIGGDTTDGILGRMIDSIYALQPSKVIILIGTNDLSNGKSVEYIISKYTQILTQTKSNIPTAQIFVQSVYPVSQPSNRVVFKSKIEELNEELKTLVNTKGLTYIDTYSVLINQEGMLDSDYSSDGLHPNERGYEVISGFIEPYL